MEALDEISDNEFHRHIDRLYDYVMANGYRFNTHVGAVFFASLYQENKQLAYDFMEKWEQDATSMALSQEEAAHLNFAQKATSLKRRLGNATSEGIAKAWSGPCGRREAMRMIGVGLTAAATAPLVSRLENLFSSARERPSCDAPAGTASPQEQAESRKEAHDWLQEVKSDFSSGWLHTALGVAVFGTGALAYRRYTADRDSKRDAILDDLSDLCRNPRIQAQLPQETNLQR